jgi:nicotinate phosphoribosyltransferase
MEMDDYISLDIPEDHTRYTDKYFIRTRKILEAEDINPNVSIKVFTRNDGVMADEAVDRITEMFDRYVPDNDVTIYAWGDEEFEQKEPLLIIEGPAQEVVELETIYLGELSHALTIKNGLNAPDPESFGENVQKAVDVYNSIGIPLLYFGARHYHWSLDKELAGQALDNGAVQTSTDIGSSNIGKNGVGTTPHFLTLVLSHEFSQENTTLKTAQLFHKHMPEDVPRTILVDTFNQEIEDAIDVLDWFNNKGYFQDEGNVVKFRIDTCGENVMQGGLPTGEMYFGGNGVTRSGVWNFRSQLIHAGYGDVTEVILSSGFGNPVKAKAFKQSFERFKNETGRKLFHGIGAGAFDNKESNYHCTADIFAVNDVPVAKTGREQGIGVMEFYKREKMEKVYG